jgi:Chaperone of endosialidase
VDFTTNYGTPPTTQSTWATATFDGAGNFSFTGLLDTDTPAARDVISSTSGADSYQVAADGTITVGNQGTTGRLSADGNLIILSAPAVNNAPEIFVGVRTGSITGLNTASGQLALNGNTTGVDNTASGALALTTNTTGNNNTAFGFQAMGLNKTGTGNAAQGYFALYANTTGVRNVGVGNYAVQHNTTGQYNIGIGWNAGGNLTTGNDNIDIASFGVAAESQTMRLGRQGTAAVTGSGITRSFIAGVNGVTTGLAGTAVMIDANGQLGTISSSRRYKQDIQPMADASERLMNLRPVKFRYRQPDAQGAKPIQYGLIAEEVAQAFPELVIRNKAGQPETVAYQVLPALLLNELQKEHRLNEQHTEQLAEVAQLKQRLAMLDARLAAQDAKIAAQTQLLAQVQKLLATLDPAANTTQVAMR